MKGLARDLLVYVTLHSVAISSLAVLGEKRIDAYLSMAILVYFVSTSILPTIREHSRLTIMDILLFTVFMAIVAYRVLSILGYSLWG